MKKENQIKTIARKTIDAFYPRRCPICDRAILGKMMTCPGCESGIRVIESPICFKCGKPLPPDSEEQYCYDCRKMVHIYDRGYAVFEYDYINKSLYRFKYSSRPEYAQFYAHVTVKELGTVIRVMRPEAFVPVPIHRSRYLKRGYNQSYEYAKWLSRLTGIPVEDKLIVREKKTKAMKELSATARQKNLKNAFKLGAYGVKLQKVCIVDDIYTTGSTIDAVARLLRQAGVQKVYFISIAIGSN